MKITIPFVRKTHGALKGRLWADLSAIPEGATITEATITIEGITSVALNEDDLAKAKEGLAREEAKHGLQWDDEAREYRPL